jgi:hypothetical protein
VPVPEPDPPVGTVVKLYPVICPVPLVAIVTVALSIVALTNVRVGADGIVNTDSVLDANEDPAKLFPV